MTWGSNNTDKWSIPWCRNCTYARQEGGRTDYLVCTHHHAGVPPSLEYLVTTAMRAEGGDCGPNGKLYFERVKGSLRSLNDAAASPDTLDAALLIGGSLLGWLVWTGIFKLIERFYG